MSRLNERIEKLLVNEGYIEVSSAEYYRIEKEAERVFNSKKAGYRGNYYKNTKPFREELNEKMQLARKEYQTTLKKYIVK